MVEFAAKIEIPENVYDVSGRTHNRLVREALREQARHHGQVRLRRHFQKGNAERYGHQARDPKYEAMKRRYLGFVLDLVRLTRGRVASKDYVTDPANQRITISGAAEGGKSKITATLKTRFPFYGGSGRARHAGSNVTIAQMVSEVQRFAQDEVEEINADLAEGYMNRLRAMPRIARRVTV